MTTLALIIGSPAQLENFRAEVVSGRLEISYDFSAGVGEEMMERIESGLPTGYIYEFELRRMRKSWFDSNLAESELSVVAMYNAVTKDYLINYKLNGELFESRIVHTPEELEASLTQFEKLPIFNLSSLEKGIRCRVRARARTGTGTFLAVIPRTYHSEWVESKAFKSPGSREQ